MITSNYSTVPAPSQPRRTYPQNWPAYNAVQTSEKDTFMALLGDLCAGIAQPEYICGRPGLPVADMVYTGTMKVYSGFSTCRFDRWYDAKWGKEKSQRHWLKAHIIVGTQTNIVTAVKITPSHVHDSPILPLLVDRTAQRFTMAEVSADKAYLSDANLRLIEGHGAYPYIPFKSNTTGQGSPMWKRLYAYFTLNEASFAAHYHRRSNVETAFSMVKGKFGDSVRAKSETGQVNEILLKFLCHNICVLIHAMHELGVTPSLESKVSPESQVRWLN